MGQRQGARGAGGVTVRRATTTSVVIPGAASLGPQARGRETHVHATSLDHQITTPDHALRLLELAELGSCWRYGGHHPCAVNERYVFHMHDMHPVVTPRISGGITLKHNTS
jgi:hypothetical protein